MEIYFQYEQYDVTMSVTATEIDGSDYEWYIESVYDNDLGVDVDIKQLSTTIQQAIEKIAESKASDKACDAALDWGLSRADFYYDSRND